MKQPNPNLIPRNLAHVRECIERACQRSGRAAADVTLVGVTKYFGAEIADALVRAGVADIGENRLQVAKPKFESMHTRPKRHFIGPLQTKKVRQVLELFDVIHSLDRIGLAQEIDKRAEQLGIEQMPCFVQINVSGEEQKGGFAPDEALSALREIESRCPHVQLIGLMTMAPIADSPEQTRPYFRKLRELQIELERAGFNVSALSMGMSGDFEVAIEEGATHVRVGSALFAS